MPGFSARLRTADRTALAALCLLLAISVSARVYTYRTTAMGPELTVSNDVVDLGDGVSLLRSDAVHHFVQIGSCAAPVAVDFVEPSPHGSDTSLALPPNPNDRVFYVYRSSILGGPRAAMKLSALYFLRRLGAVLRMSGSEAQDHLALKVIVPAGCGASPEDVMSALRQDVRQGK